MHSTVWPGVMWRRTAAYGIFPAARCPVCMQVDGMLAGHDAISSFGERSPHRLRLLAAQWAGWADTQGNAAVQLDSARHMLQRLPCDVDLPADVNLAIMMQSITYAAGAGSVEELLESDAADTELDEQLATVTTTDDGVYGSSASAAAPGAQLSHSVASMGYAGGSSTLPSSSAGLDMTAWSGMHVGSPMGVDSVVGGRWRPLGESVETQLAAEAAVGALARAHEAAAAALANAAAAQCAWGAGAPMAAEDVAAVTSAAFTRGQGVPDSLQVAWAAFERLQCEGAWRRRPGAAPATSAMPAPIPMPAQLRWG